MPYVIFTDFQWNHDFDDSVNINNFLLVLQSSSSKKNIGKTSTNCYFKAQFS